MFPRRNNDAPKIQNGPPLPPVKRPRMLLNLNPPTNSNDDLSLDVIEHIISFLPVREAVQASLIAKRFKNSWKLSRHIHFERDFARRFDRLQLCGLVTHVLSVHKGPVIKSLAVHIDANGLELFVNSWVRDCVAKGLEELDLDLWQPAPWPYFLFPQSYANVESFRVLKLSYSIIQLPPDFKGLTLLTTLILRRAGITEPSLQLLFVHCPLLKTLEMSRCRGFRHLRVHAGEHFKVLKVGHCSARVRGIEINAPSLQSLYYTGPLHNFYILIYQPLLKLEEAVINVTPCRSSTGFINPLQVEKLVSDIDYVKTLTLTSAFLEGLSPKIRNGYFQEMQYSFRNLKEVHLIMEDPSFCNVGDIAAFLRNCPCLETLFIDATQFTFDGGFYWELHQKPLLDINFGFFVDLKVIKIKGFKFENRHMNLVKFLLEKARFLDSMILVFTRSFRLTPDLLPDLHYYTNLFAAWRQAPQASITLYHAWEDKNSVHPTQTRIWY